MIVKLKNKILILDLKNKTPPIMGLPMVISFVSRKGGTGKTTNAIHLATSLFGMGKRVVVLETDTNYTLATLREMELSQAPEAPTQQEPFPIIASTDEAIITDLAKIKAQHKPDYIIIDSAGKTTDADIRKLCLESDLLIIPTSLSRNDVLVSYQTIEDLKPALTLKPGLKMAVLPNRINSQTKIQTILSGLEVLDAHIIRSFLPQKNIYSQFSTLNPEPDYLVVTREILAFLF
jgi:chromosome partitioning protein